MADGEDRSPEDEFQELLRRLLGGQPGAIDPEQLSRLSGMGIDPAMMSAMMQQMQSAFSQAPAEGISWDIAKRQALHIANQEGLGISSGERTDLGEAFALANLWLSEATTISELTQAPRTLTRGGWVEATLPVWQELAEPVALSIADALTAALNEQVPEEMRAVVQGAGRLMRTVGGSLFAAQLGAVVGRLSTEVVSGGDVGLPVMPAGEAAILPQNFADFGRDLGIADDQLALYLATRELAHARLFRHARWLRLHVISQVTEFARGIHVDTSALEDLASRFDPSQPEELRQALESGALLPQRSEAQTAALARLENLLALIEGWVDVVTDAATARLPEADRIAEVVRRRRAVGGPAEQALGSLVGLELRPRRLREAAAMWRAVTDAVGAADRDGLWDYPDLMPTAEDIDDPAALVARLQARARGDEPQRDAMDDALEALLNQAASEEAAADRDETPGAPGDEATDAAAGDEPATDGGAGDEPEGPRPV
ncbi:zinc-dependent metalloprotease [Microbacterium sp. zg.Y625]|uniref:zinc-dependent metalloprotease n=1 Tax=Microbacterium jiangjiandongii TaxID=3049071 RepID=UPI00214AC74D|nr:MULTISPECIES: zinc-dependent metalloprotease [unclassified Microbacterium]MCR2793098.1 zinc-dependent metalloprotease [Microbacterium sp. zg.Y625]WIM24208.1 zinc-dependent metalloprotease [Microbacterium sp. zg-Y625]